MWETGVEIQFCWNASFFQTALHDITIVSQRVELTSRDISRWEFGMVLGCQCGEHGCILWISVCRFVELIHAFPINDRRTLRILSVRLVHVLIFWRAIFWMDAGRLLGNNAFQARFELCVVDNLVCDAES